MTSRLAPFALALLALLAGCAPAIGDECSSSVDCSVSGDRICDSASPGGYCTVANCEQNTCPDEAVCVEFRGDPARLAESWCMAPCDDSGDCREDEGYRCVRASTILDQTSGLPIAEVLDSGGDGRAFCAAVVP